MYPVKLAKSIPCEAEREKKKHGCHDDPNATNLKSKLTNNPAAGSGSKSFDLTGARRGDMNT